MNDFYSKTGDSGTGTVLHNCTVVWRREYCTCCAWDTAEFVVINHFYSKTGDFSRCVEQLLNQVAKFALVMNSFCYPLFCPSVHSSIEYRNTKPLLYWAGVHTSWQNLQLLHLGALPTDTGGLLKREGSIEYRKEGVRVPSLHSLTCSDEQNRR